jgi:hypothetical protein
MNMQPIFVDDGRNRSCVPNQASPFAEPRVGVPRRVRPQTTNQKPVLNFPKHNRVLSCLSPRPSLYSLATTNLPLASAAAEAAAPAAGGGGGGEAAEVRLLVARRGSCVRARGRVRVAGAACCFPLWCVRWIGAARRRPMQFER